MSCKPNFTTSHNEHSFILHSVRKLNQTVMNAKKKVQKNGVSGNRRFAQNTVIYTVYIILCHIAQFAKK